VLGAIKLPKIAFLKKIDKLSGFVGCFCLFDHSRVGILYTCSNAMYSKHHRGKKDFFPDQQN
jgi:hypothetical protein